MESSARPARPRHGSGAPQIISGSARRTTRTLVVAVAAILVSLAAALTVNGRSQATGAACTIAAGGDVAASGDYQTGAAATANLIKTAAPTAVLALGDLAYDSGTDQEFSSYYAPTWGQFRSITKPVPGNHEYLSGGGGYFRYFGAASYYAYDVCGWRAVALDAEISHTEQITFLRAERAAHTNQPFLVYWHEPRWSSGIEHGSDPAYQDLWQAAVDAGAKIVLNGHDHDYERFAPMNASGAADSNGTREFVAGTGGHNPRDFGTTQPNSEKRVTGRPGILLLTLTSTSYTWNYQDTAGTQDTGTWTFPTAINTSSPTATAAPTPTLAAPTSTSTSATASPSPTATTATPSPTASRTRAPKVCHRPNKPCPSLSPAG